MFCPSCHQRVNFPFKIGPKMSFGKINLSCSCKNGLVIVEGTGKPIITAKNLTKSKKSVVSKVQRIKKEKKKKLINTIVYDLKVRTSKGLVDISSIKKGDRILGDKGKYNTVLEADPGQSEGTFYKINNTVILFSEQTIIANNNGKHVRLLEVGDTIYGLKGKKIKVKTIKKVKETFYFYKLKINGDHTYYLNDILVHNASRFWVGGTAGWTTLNLTSWSISTGGVGGATVPGAGDTANFDASSGGGTVTPNYNMSLGNLNMGAFGGTLDFSVNNNSPTISGAFNCSGTGVRTFKAGTGTWTMTGTVSVVWQLSVITNLTATVSGCTITMSGNGAQITGGSLTYGIVNFTGGGVNVIGSTNTFGTLSYTGVGASDSFQINQNQIVTGTLTITGNSSSNKVAIMTSAAGTLRTFTFGSASFTNIASWTDISLTQNASGGSWTLNEALNLASASVFPILSIGQGSFSAGSFNITAGSLASTGSSTRSISLGSSLVSLYGNSGNVLSLASTGLTITAGTSTIKLTDTSNANITFVGASFTLNNVYYSRGASTGNITSSGNYTVNNIKDDGTAAHSVLFTAGQTFTFSSWNISGTAGNLITLNSTTTAVANIVNAGEANVSADYLKIQHIVSTPVTPGIIFYAGRNSVNNQNVDSTGSGISFGAPGDINGNMFMLM